MAYNPRTLKHLKFIERFAGKINAKEIAKKLGLSPNYVRALAAENGISLVIGRSGQKATLPRRPKTKVIDVPYNKAALNFSKEEDIAFCQKWR